MCPDDLDVQLKKWLGKPYDASVITCIVPSKLPFFAPKELLMIDKVNNSLFVLLCGKHYHDSYKW